MFVFRSHQLLNLSNVSAFGTRSSCSSSQEIYCQALTKLGVELGGIGWNWLPLEVELAAKWPFLSTISVLLENADFVVMQNVLHN